MRYSRRHLLQLGALAGGSLIGKPIFSASAATDSGSEPDPWNSARTQLVLNPRLAYFDTAQFAPSSRAVLASEYRAQESLHTDPDAFYAERYSASAVQELCKRLSGWLGCNVDELCLTRGALAGLMQCAQTLNLQSGDEILLAAQLPDSLRRFWQQQARQRSLVLKTISLPVPLHSEAEVLSAFEAAASERSRVLVCSHAQYVDGSILPLRGLCQWARTRNLISMINGSLSLGALQFSLRDLDCDIYGASLCHWLNGPQQTGALYVRAEMQAALLYESVGTAEPLRISRDGWPTLLQRWPTDFIELAPQFQSLSSALTWQENVGRARIEARLRELQLYARLRVQALNDVELLTSTQPGMWLHLLSLRSSKRNAVELASWLKNNDKVIVSGFNATQDGMNALRVSFHIYNSHDEIDRLMQGLQRALRA
ncbi:MAG: aminotransferase class V-fold PLP-dependent enzyme [Steroidobacteraceae bacterium]